MPWMTIRNSWQTAHRWSIPQVNGVHSNSTNTCLPFHLWEPMKRGSNFVTRVAGNIWTGAQTVKAPKSECWRGEHISIDAWSSHIKSMLSPDGLAALKLSDRCTHWSCVRACVCSKTLGPLLPGGLVWNEAANYVIGVSSYSYCE